MKAENQAGQMVESMIKLRNLHLALYGSARYVSRCTTTERNLDTIY